MNQLHVLIFWVTWLTLLTLRWMHASSCVKWKGIYNVLFTSGRILAGCYWFCILISISTYTANLAAFFTVKNAEQPIHNLEDIVKSSYQVGVVESSSTYEAFKTSQYETHRKIWHRMQSAGTMAQSTSEGIQWVRERKDYLFITDGPIVRQAANEPPCELTTGN